MEVLHTAIWVSDLETTIAFYCDGLDLEHSRDFVSDGIRNYFVTGGSDAGIQFKYDPRGEADVTPSGIDHFSVRVDDVRVTFDNLTREHGGEAITEPMVSDATDSVLAFVSDPDGYMVELIRDA